MCSMLSTYVKPNPLHQVTFKQSAIGADGEPVDKKKNALYYIAENMVRMGYFLQNGYDGKEVTEEQLLESANIIAQQTQIVVDELSKNNSGRTR